MTQRLVRQGEGHLAATIRWHQEDIALERAIAAAVLAADANAPDHACTGNYLAGDAQRLRGVPVIARGVTGTSPGTAPGARL